MWHIWGKEAHTRCWWEKLRERDRKEDLGEDGMILTWIFNEQDKGRGVD
jgi:hypothetical protein